MLQVKQLTINNSRTAFVLLFISQQQTPKCDGYQHVSHLISFRLPVCAQMSLNTAHKQ